MMEYGAAVLGQVVGVLLWSFLNAAILLWRARKLKSWAIRSRMRMWSRSKPDSLAWSSPMQQFLP